MLRCYAKLVDRRKKMKSEKNIYFSFYNGNEIKKCGDKF